MMRYDILSKWTILLTFNYLILIETLQHMLNIKWISIQKNKYSTVIITYQQLIQNHKQSKDHKYFEAWQDGSIGRQ